MDKKDLRAKAYGFTIAFERMGVTERTNPPSDTYAEDYNALREAVIELVPDLKTIMPPEVEIEESGSSFRYSSQSFAEINAYCEQIVQMLSGTNE